MRKNSLSTRRKSQGDIWKLPLVEEDWVAICQALYQGIVAMDWGEMRNKMKKLSRCGVKKAGQRVEGLEKLAWRRKEDVKTGENCFFLGFPSRRGIRSNLGYAKVGTLAETSDRSCVIFLDGLVTPPLTVGGASKEVCVFLHQSLPWLMGQPCAGFV